MRRSMLIWPVCVSASATGPAKTFVTAFASGFPVARRASNFPIAAKNRSTSASHGSGVASCQTALPSHIVSAQSRRSPMCARIWTGVRDVGPAWKSPKPSGAPRTALAARYASVATVWRRRERSEAASLMNPP